MMVMDASAELTRPGEDVGAITPVHRDRMVKLLLATMAVDRGHVVLGTVQQLARHSDLNE